jgi:glycosyltransferase involved in cell wall biosynthesis
VPSGPVKRLSGRVADLPADKVTAYNLLGIRYERALRRGPRTDTQHLYARLFGERVAACRHLMTATAVYGMAGFSLEFMRAAKRRRILCVLEQMNAPIATMRAIFASATANWPGWQEGGPIDWNDSVWAPRAAEEWELADVVVAPSAFVRASLLAVGVPARKIVVMPYAVSAVDIQRRERAVDATRPLRVLFVGGLSLEKGIPHLLQALRMLGPDAVQARLVGQPLIRAERLSEYRDVAAAIGFVPRTEVARHYDWADVFVLPSLCEGSATVTYEAAVRGLPVVATTNAGSWVSDGEDGFVVPAGDTEAIARALQRLRETPGLLQRMSCAALGRAREYTWEAYQARLAGLMVSLHGELR